MSWAYPDLDDFLQDYQLKNKSSRKLQYGDEPILLPYQLTYTPPSLNFGLVMVDTLSPYQDVVVKNTGFLPITIYYIKVYGSFTVQHTAPGVLPPGSSFTIRVRFAPVGPGEQSGSIYIASPSKINNVIELTGEGTEYNLLLDGTWFLNGVYQLDGLRNL